MIYGLHVPEDGSLDPEHEEEEGQLQAATSMTRQPWARSGEVGIYKGTKYPLCIRSMALTVPKVIDFQKNNTKCSGENEVLSGIFRVVSRSPLHFLLLLGLSN